MDKELNIKGLNMHAFRIIVMLIMMLFSTTSYAIDGTGKKSDPFLIKEPSDIVDLRAYLNQLSGFSFANQGKYIYVKQVADIDLLELSNTTNQNKQCPPLPLSANNFLRGILNYAQNNCFLGEYDGGGYTIKNWIISSSKMPATVNTAEYCISLFGKVGMEGKEMSVIKNLNIEGFDIETPQTDGENIPGFSFIASTAINAEFTNCHVKDSKIQGDGHFVFGAIVGQNEDASISNCSVRNCIYNTSTGSSKVGSICGSNGGDISNCFADNVTLTGETFVGGLIGYQSGGTIENCGFKGTINLTTENKDVNSGGLCGRIGKGSFINCFSIVDNGGKSWNNVRAFGGLIGIVTDEAVIRVQNCYTFPQIKINQKTCKNIDFFVGRDVRKEESNRVYESCYCYENAFGVGYKTIWQEGKDFSEEYKEKHQLLIAESDYMRSGCFALALKEYHNSNLKNILGDNQWREDVELQNDTLPVLHFMVDSKYDEEPFCHPLVFTISHKEVGNVSILNGRYKYVTKEQPFEKWSFGFEVKVGNGQWKKYNVESSSQDFVKEVEYSCSKTTVFRAYTEEATTGMIAYGKIDTICIGTSAGPEILTGCDSVKYEGKWYYVSDNGSHKNAAGDEFIIDLNKSTINYLPLLEGACGATEVADPNYENIVYYHSGTYDTTFINKETGCNTTNYQPVKLYPTFVKDSLKVFSLGEMSYTYVPLDGTGTHTVNVGSEYVLEQTELYTDHTYYNKKNGKECDSAIVNVRYLIPIKITKIEDETWSCKPVVYKGIAYTKETTITDTAVTSDLNGVKLYEITIRHIKAAAPDTIKVTEPHCGDKIEYTCPSGICTSTEPFFDTVPSLKTIPGTLCPQNITITHYTLGKKPTREESIVSCGPYSYIYRGKTTIWEKSGDYQVVRSGKNLGACDNDTTVTYHVTIGESTNYKDTTIHSCSSFAYKTMSGEFVFFDKTQDYEDKIETPDGCSSSRIIHVYIHKKIDKSPNSPIKDCAPYEFTKLNGEKITLTAGDYIFNDTIRSADGCGCDSIVKTTTIKLDNPTVLQDSIKKSCDEIEIAGILCTKDTSFVINKTNIHSSKVCTKEIQKFNVSILPSKVETIHVDTCGVFAKDNKSLDHSGIIEFTHPNADGCEDKTIYDVRIIELRRIDSVVYACDNYVHKFYDGHQKMIENDGTVLYDTLQSKVCKCDSIIRKVTVNISHDSHEVLPAVSNCGPYIYAKKSNGKQILIETSRTVLDTLVNKYGCSIYYETEVNIIPVETTFDTLDACKEYHSVVNVWNYGNKPVDVEEATPSIKTTELIFLKPNAANASCKDTTKLFLRVHGVGNVIADPVVECDSFTYVDFDGSKKKITENVIIVDTLKSTVCDCDSIIKTTNITINKSIPESQRRSVSLRSCDSVIYKNSKGIDMTFFDDIRFQDTFAMKNTGCDSVVIVEITVPKSTGRVSLLSACGDTTLYDEVNNNFPHFFGKSDSWHQVLSKNEAGCDNYIDWQVFITPTPRDTIFQSGCGELTFNNETYTSDNEKAASFGVELKGATKCDTIFNYILTVYPKYNNYYSNEYCDSAVIDGKVYKQTILLIDTLMSRNNCDSVINRNVIINPSPNVKDYIEGCYEVTFQDPDYNGNLAVSFNHDTTIYVNKITDKGCDYKLIQQIHVGYPSDSSEYWSECFDSENGYASFRDLKLTSDTIIYDTITSVFNKCGTIVKNNVHLIMPVHDTIYIDSCLHITYQGAVYKDSAEVIRKTKTVDGCDTIKHIMLNVNKCFPYPILVNKYNWILVCNDNILNEDKFKKKTNVKYKWYKDDRLIATTTDSYFTEDKELDGCYQVGIIVNGGDEYLSDIVCIDENHGYSISPQPNPVDKLQPITIKCDFPVEGVVGTYIEVFNMTADKVYAAKATSNEIVIPGMSVSGYYLVRLTTVSGKVLTAKFAVK